MQAMFIVWNELLDLPIHMVSYTTNVSLAAMHSTLSLPPCAAGVWKATNIFLLFSCVLIKECEILYICIYRYIAILGRFSGVACQLSALDNQFPYPKPLLM